MTRLTTKYLIQMPLVLCKTKTISNSSRLASGKTHTQHERPLNFITRNNIKIYLN